MAGHLANRAWQPVCLDNTDSDCLQVSEDLADSWPRSWILGEAPPSQGPDLRRHEVQMWLTVDDAIHHRHCRPGAKRAFAGSREHQHRTKAENVTGRPNLTAFNLFWRHEARRSDHQSGTSKGARLGSTGDPEVNNSGTVLGEQHIRGLQIAMYYPSGMDLAKSFRQASCQCEHYRSGKRPVHVHDLCQGWTFDIRRRQPRNRILYAGIDNRRGKQATDFPGCGYLPRESNPEIRAVS